MSDTKTPIDNAELREFLSKAIKRLEHVTGCDKHFFHPDATSCDGKTSMGECNHKRTCELIFESRKALAKPPRNSADNNQVPVVPSVPEVPSVPSTIAELRQALVGIKFLAEDIRETYYNENIVQKDAQAILGKVEIALAAFYESETP